MVKKNHRRRSRLSLTRRTPCIETRERADFCILQGMNTPRAMSTIWRKDTWRCELWAAGISEGEGYQLKLYRDHELVRLQDVPLLVYPQLAFSWKLELENAATGNA